MAKKKIIIVVFLFLLILLIGLAFLFKNRRTSIFLSSAPSASPTIALNWQLYKVVKVVDGDTIMVEIDNQKQTIRLIGVDAPELYKNQCFAREATVKAKEILTGKNVFLEKDPTQDDKDEYDRLLRFIFLEDGINFNQLMIKEGYAREYTYLGVPYKYQKEFQTAEHEAKVNKKGLWEDDACL